MIRIKTLPRIGQTVCIQVMGISFQGKVDAINFDTVILKTWHINDDLKINKTFLRNINIYHIQAWWIIPNGEESK